MKNKNINPNRDWQVWISLSDKEDIVIKKLFNKPLIIFSASCFSFKELRPRLNFGVKRTITLKM